MNPLMTLIVAKEMARTKGIDDPRDQFRIGAIASVVPNAAFGLAIANAVADREAPAARDDTAPTPPVTPDPKAIEAELEKVRAQLKELTERQRKLEEQLKAMQAQAGATPPAQGTPATPPAGTPRKA